MFFFQAEDGIRDLVRSRGLGDVYKRQAVDQPAGDVQRCTHPFKAVAAVHVGHPAAGGAPLGSLLILGGWGGHRWWARRCVRVRIGRGIRQQPLLGPDVGCLL